MRQVKHLLLVLLSWLSIAPLVSAVPQQFDSVEDYVERYKDMAISEMHRSQIPASIKLAQAIVESNYGNSFLAQNGNNHFGIKCHSKWSGGKIYRDDDKANECFRSYGTDYDSYMDHSNFLQQNRYQHLKELPFTDYKAWANGLRQAGYATSKTYSDQLISVIERYGLSYFDLGSTPGESPIASNTPRQSTEQRSRNTDYTSNESRARNSKTDYTKNKSRANTSSRKTRSKADYTRNESRVRSSSSNRLRESDVFYYNRIKTVVTYGKSSPLQLAQMYGLPVQRLCDYNDFIENQVIPSDTKVYLQPKRNKGPVNIPTHKVKIGETMKDIAQHYGIKESKLYKRNKMYKRQEVAPGEIIYLRGKRKNRPKLMSDYYGEEEASDEGSYIPDEFKKKSNNKSSNSRNSKSATARTSKKSRSTDYSKKSRGTDYSKKSRSTDYSKSSSNSDWVKKQYETKQDTAKNRPEDKDVRPTYFDTYQKTKDLEGPRTAPKPVTKPVTKPSPVKDTRPVTKPNPAPTAKDTRPVAKPNTAPVNSNPKVDSYRTIEKYVVKPGDTLYKISKLFGSPITEIKRLNGLDDTNLIRVGQELKIPIF